MGMTLYKDVVNKNDMFYTLLTNTVDGNPPTAVFDTTDVVGLPSHGMFCRLGVNHFGERVGVAASVETIPSFLVFTPTKSIRLGNVYGTQSVGIRPLNDGRFRLFVQRSAAKWAAINVSADLSVLGQEESFDVPANAQGSQGFLHTEGPEPLWTDPNRILVREGVRLVLPHTSLGWSVGQAPDEDAVYLVTPAGVHRRLGMYTPTQPRIAANQYGQIMVAVSNMVPDFYTLKDFAKVTAPTTPPPVDDPKPEPPPMPTFPDQLDFINSRPYKGILGTPKDPRDANNNPTDDLSQKRRENAFRFCATAAKEMRDRGLDAGVLLKSGGANVAGYASDIICLRSEGVVRHYDAVTGNEAEGAGTTWIDHGDMDPARFALPPSEWQVSGSPTVPPPDDENSDDPPADDTELVNILETMAEDLHLLKVQHNTLMGDMATLVGNQARLSEQLLREIQIAVRAIQAAVPPPPVYKGSAKLLGYPVTFTLTPQ